MINFEARNMCEIPVSTSTVETFESKLVYSCRGQMVLIRGPHGYCSLLEEADNDVSGVQEESQPEYSK